MDGKTTEAMDVLEKLIGDKRTQYAGVKGMEGFLTFLDDTIAEVSVRMMIEEVDADYFKAVCEDVKQQEYHHRAENGLLTPEEAAARKMIRDFFNSPCDLPPEVK